MPVDVDKFAELLSQSGLFEAKEAKTIVESVPAEKRGDVKTLASELIKSGKLTQYQATQLYYGRTRGLVLGDYVVQAMIGKGGMGMVFKAYHRRMDRTVALKVLPVTATNSPAKLKRFHREVKAAAKLSHQNIVMAHDAGEAGGVHYLVMEYVDGQDLHAIVKKNGPLAVAQVVDCIRQAGRGLEYAHGKEIIHRDIKPSNLLLDNDGTVKILDMGLARIDAGERGEEDLSTESGVVMGTIDFMAPEQSVDAHGVDARADIYSLGCTLYYLLSRKVPYPADSMIGKIRAHADRPIPSLKEACPGAPDRLHETFARMVAKTPEERYQTMTEALADLEQCVPDQVPSLTPVAASRSTDPSVTEFLDAITPTGTWQDQQSQPAETIDPVASAQTPTHIGKIKQSLQQKPRPKWLLPASVAAVVLLVAAAVVVPNCGSRSKTKKATSLPR